MFSVVEFLPAVRFNSRRSKLIILSLTTAVAAIWLEGIVPHFTDRATGDFADAVAMGIGFAVFWTYDSIVASRRKRSVCGRLVRDFELDPSLRDRVLQSDI